MPDIDEIIRRFVATGFSHARCGELEVLKTRDKKVAISYSRADGTLMYECAADNACGEVNPSSVIELLEACERLEAALTQIDGAINTLTAEARSDKL